MHLFFILLIAHVFFGILAYGKTLSSFQKIYPPRANEGFNDDRNFALCFGLMGLVGFLISHILSHKEKCGYMFVWNNPN